MTLIKSISGIRGTIGGSPGEGLTPPDIIKYASAYGTWLKEQSEKDSFYVILGRDARVSGEMVSTLVAAGLSAMGIDVDDIGLASTPTVEMAVIDKKADGGIIITASHNPGEWNALKLLNKYGEFLSAEDGEKIVNIADSESVAYSGVDSLGKVRQIEPFHKQHIQKILELPLVDINAIKQAHFKIIVDCVNSVGGVILPELLNALGVDEIIQLHCNLNGIFPHDPEPIPKNLSEICREVKDQGADLGLVVDPDVDRLAIVNEDGTLFGEEYTLVAVADYVLSNKPGNTVSNLSSTRALKDLTEKYDASYYASPVGEVNVVSEMKKRNAVVGGEGNGGVIFPELHYGRDALVGAALFLSHLAKTGLKTSQLRSSLPDYYICKTKLTMDHEFDINMLVSQLQKKYPASVIDLADGIRIDMKKEWIHVRKSNTEPVFRIIAESENEARSETLVREVMDLLNAL